MDSLINIICKLRSVFETIKMEDDLKFPQIVVIGTQSAGKSSVIEGIVGRDFLPRGADIVTRRPLEIQLICTPKDDPQRKETHRCLNDDWATFDHLQDKKIFDFEEVREEIEKITNDTVGTEKGVSSDPIYLKIYSANVVDLTMVDLPGFTKVPVGKQPLNIEKIIYNMAMKYIDNPNSIILAVTPANQDFAASDSLKVAREVDNNGDRTLCVLTKLDLMDEGTDAKRVLNNEVLQNPVKLGIIGVVGRSQNDIVNKKTVRQCLEDEAKFFNDNYPASADKNGIPFLAKTLNRLLLANIHKVLPELKKRIFNMTSNYERKFESFGELIADDEKDRKLVEVIIRFVTALNNLIDGNCDIVETSKEVGGALLFDVFYKHFADEMQNIDPLRGLDNSAILTARKNIQSTTPEVFPNQKVFEALVKKQMSLLLDEPCLNCVDFVHERLLNIVDHCGSELQNDKNRFPILFERMEENITLFVKNLISPTKKIVQTILNGHRAHINTKHPDFQNVISRIKIDDIKIKPTAQSASLSQSLTPEEDNFIKLMNDLIKEYFNIILKSVQDQIPKLCMDNVVINLKKELHTHLVIELQEIQKHENLLGEGAQVARNRAEISEMLIALTDANNVLNQVAQTNI